eukprot:scaffold302468_cov18-Prasinocladus_malaysianus.AAC.1
MDIVLYVLQCACGSKDVSFGTGTTLPLVNVKPTKCYAYVGACGAAASARDLRLLIVVNFASVAINACM